MPYKKLISFVVLFSCILTITGQNHILAISSRKNQFLRPPTGIEKSQDIHKTSEISEGFPAYETIKNLFQEEFLFSNWKIYVAFLDSVEGKSGRIGKGYHRYEHGLEVAFLTWLTVKDTYTSEEILETVIAASLHDFDIRDSYQPASVDRTLEQLDNNPDLGKALAELKVDKNAVRLLIERTNYPWDKNREEKFKEGLNKIENKKKRDSIKERAEILQLLDKSSTYVCLDRTHSMDRIVALSVELQTGKNAQDMLQITLDFMSGLEKDPLFRTILEEKLLPWAKDNWDKNKIYYSEMIGKFPSVSDKISQKFPDYETIKALFQNEFLFSNWKVYVAFLDSVKGKSGLIGEGYNRYEHGLEVAFLIWLTVKKGIEEGRYKPFELLETVIAASLHDFDIREPYQLPKVERTIKQLETNRELINALGKLEIDRKTVILLIERTNYPWDKNREEKFNQKLNEIVDKGRRDSTQTRSQLLQFLDKLATYVCLDPKQTEKIIIDLHLELKTNKNPAEIYQETLVFLDGLKDDPLFNTTLQKLPKWAKENWDNNYNHYSEKMENINRAYGSEVKTGTLSLKAINRNSELKKKFLEAIFSSL
ncbi:MAG: HD domain-containing protein [Elusimicrobiota bacterium]